MIARITADEWKENEHPRSENGQFGSGGKFEAGELEIEQPKKDLGEGLKAHPFDKMRDYTPKELDWEYEVEYKKYSQSAFPGAFTSREDFQKKYDDAPMRALTAQELKGLGNSMAASGIGKNEDWVHKTFSHRRDSKRILKDLREGQTAPPIILKKNGKLRLMAGQTRLASGMALGISVPAKIIDVSKHGAEDDFEESKHPRGQPGNAGQFASTQGSGSTGVAEKINPRIQKLMSVGGFKLQKGTSTFVHPSGAKVVILPDKKSKQSSIWISHKPGQISKGGEGYKDLGKLLRLSLQAVEQVKEAQAAEIKQAAEKTVEQTPEAPKDFTAKVSEFSSKHGVKLGGAQGKSLDKGKLMSVTGMENGMLFNKGASNILITPQEDWIVQTPGFSGKQGKGLDNLGKLLSGEKGFGTNWTNAMQSIPFVGESVTSTPAQPAKPKQAQLVAPPDNPTYSHLSSIKPEATAKEKGSVGKYSGNGYKEINVKLRHNENPDEEESSTIQNIDSWVKKGKLPKCTLFRGVQGDYAKFLKSVMDVDTIFTDKGFISTTTKTDMGFVAGAQLKFQIDVPEGSIGAALGEYSHHPNEHEVLLPRKTKFHVTKIEGGIIYCTVKQEHLK